MWVVVGGAAYSLCVISDGLMWQDKGTEQDTTIKKASGCKVLTSCLFVKS